MMFESLCVIFLCYAQYVSQKFSFFSLKIPQKSTCQAGAVVCECKLLFDTCCVPIVNSKENWRLWSLTVIRSVCVNRQIRIVFNFYHHSSIRAQDTHTYTQRYYFLCCYSTHTYTHTRIVVCIRHLLSGALSLKCSCQTTFSIIVAIPNITFAFDSFHTSQSICSNQLVAAKSELSKWRFRLSATRFVYRPSRTICRFGIRTSNKLT